MTDSSPAESAAAEHIAYKLTRMIDDAARSAETQETAGRAALGTARGMRYCEAAEFQRALAARLRRIVVAVKGDGRFPGAPGSRWRDGDGDMWIHGDDGRMWPVDELEEPDEPGSLEQHLGPMTHAGGA